MDRPELDGPEMTSEAAPHEGNSPLAGVVSAAIHAAAVILLALFWTNASQGIVDERPREVGIRLVSKASLSSRTATEETSTEAPDAETTAAKGSTADLASALPNSGAPDSLPELAPSENLEGIPGLTDLPGFSDASAGGGVFPGTSEGDAALIAEEQAAIAAGRPQGQVSNVSLFGGASSSGRSFVFAIDRSQSMGSEGIGAIDAAVEELARAVDGLDKTNRFQIVAYNRDLVFLDGDRKLLQKTPQSGEKTRRFVDTLAAFGPTEHHRALLSALALAPEVIYLLTDGGDPGMSDLEIAQVARIAGSRTTVHVVCFGRRELSDSAESLRRLAETCRGNFTFVDLAKRD